MSLQNVIRSRALVGTSSSGASLTPYEKQWEHQDPEDANILLGSPELSEDVDRTIGLAPQLGLPSYAGHTFPTDMTMLMASWRGIFRFPEQLEPTAAYSVIAEPQKSDILRISWSGRSTTVDIDQEDFYRQLIQYWQRRDILERFEVLAQREYNWDGYESKKPTQSTLDTAKSLMEELLETISFAKYSWVHPFISSDEDGYVTAEWQKGGRRLHLQIGENETEYIQVWGTNIDTEMHVDFLNKDGYLTLWEWLFDE